MTDLLQGCYMELNSKLQLPARKKTFTKENSWSELGQKQESGQLTTQQTGRNSWSPVLLDDENQIKQEDFF